MCVHIGMYDVTAVGRCVCVHVCGHICTCAYVVQRAVLDGSSGVKNFPLEVEFLTNP